MVDTRSNGQLMIVWRRAQVCSQPCSDGKCPNPCTLSRDRNGSPDKQTGLPRSSERRCSKSCGSQRLERDFPLREVCAVLAAYGGRG